MRAQFTDEPFDITIVDGNLICSLPDGPALSMPLRVARINMARCTKALAEHDGHSAAVVAIRKNGRDG